MYRSFFKRYVDFFLSLLALIMLCPLFILIFMLNKLTSKGPAFFVQQRAGLDFKPFNLYKFRSMVSDPAINGLGITSHDDSRITRLGRVLRRTKLDELPQLLNVLKGEMSLVGPRPELFKYVYSFEDSYKAILTVRPGLTDYAAVKFRDEEKILSGYEDKEKAYLESILPEKIKLYVDYIHDLSFYTDIKLIVMTIHRILI